MRPCLIADRVDQPRRIAKNLLRRGKLAVEDSQRVGLEPTAAVFVQRVCVWTQKGDQCLAIVQTIGSITQRIELQFDQAVDPESAPETRAQGQQFDIGRCFLKPENLDPGLVKLTLASFLRPLVAKHRTAIPQLDAGRVQQAVLQRGANHAGGTLRPKANAFTIAVVEGIHFLFDHICPLPDRTHEQLGALQKRQSDFIKTVG